MFGGKKMWQGNYPPGYRDDEELYVYDQCCQNCRYCDEESEGNGCEKRDREDYEPFPPTNWCVDWKGKGGRH